MIHPTIAALASETATGELQNVRITTATRLGVDLERAAAAVKSIANYKVGDSRATLLEIEEMVRQSQYSERDQDAIAKILGDVLTSGASNDAKAFACRQLWIIGTEKEGDALASLLKDPALSDMARYGLQNIMHPGVDTALIAALDGTDPKVQIGCINSLAHRKSDKALDAIKPLKKSKNKEVAAAAKHAIARLEGKLV